MGNSFSTFGYRSNGIAATTPPYQGTITISITVTVTAGLAHPAVYQTPIAHQAPVPTPAHPQATIYDDKFAQSELRRLTEKTIAGPNTEAPKKPKKTKTREARTTTEPTNANPPPAPASKEENRQFPVNQRAHDVFSSVFPDPKNKNAFCEVKYADLLWAMAEIGFAADERTRSSTTKLTPTFDRVGSIQGINLHRPHPETRVRPRTVRRFGKRLTNRYGISRETIVLA